MAFEYLVETKKFQHQRKNPNKVDDQGQQVEAEPTPELDMKTYLDGQGASDWELIEVVPLAFTSKHYQFTFFFKKETP